MDGKGILSVFFYFQWSQWLTYILLLGAHWAIGNTTSLYFYFTDFIYLLFSKVLKYIKSLHIFFVISHTINFDSMFVIKMSLNIP